MQKITRHPMNKKTKTIVTVAVIAAVLALVVLPGLFRAPAPDMVLDLSQTRVLSPRSMEKRISATGLVESADSTKVYSTKSYPVMEVCVEEGQQVQAGEVLALLDGSSLQDQITQQEIGMSVTDRGSQQQIQSAQTSYDNFKSGLEQGLNTTLNSAQSQVDGAYEAYERAVLNYERQVDSLHRGENASLIAAESGVETAERAMDQAADSLEDLETACDGAKEVRKTAKEAWETAEEAGLPEAESLKAAYEAADGKYQELVSAKEQAKTAYRSARNAYETQLASYHAAAAAQDNLTEDYQTAVDTAWKNYQDALVAQEAAKKAVNDQLKGYETALSNARANADNATGKESLRQLQENLEDMKITAPCGGTVTAIYAQEGASGAGLLFLIEDTERLMVSTTVKGYDMGQVREGLAVKVRSDALPEEEFDGQITKIASAAVKNAAGNTDVTTGDPVFEAEVTILSKDTGLKIGMEAELDYIIWQETDVLAVPYEAVYRNDQGQTCVLVAREQEDGLWLVQETEVTAGADDDLDRIISGDAVSEGMRVISDAALYRDYVGQSLPEGTLNKGGMMAMMGGGMG